MKNLKFIILGLLLVAQTATYAIGIDMGVEFAVSQANFKFKGGDPAIDNELGYGIGVSAKADLPLVEVGPELWYYRNKMSIEGVEVKSNSIDLPVVVSYSILGPLKLEAGPAFSLMSKSKAELSDGTSVDMGRIRPEMGYVVGARLTILKVLIVGARFNGCFSRQSFGYGTESYQMRYNSVSVSVGAKF